MKTRATVRLKFPSEKHLEVVSNALKPEIGRPATARSRTVLEKDRNLLILKVKAKDTTALRATLNAYLRWIKSLANVLKVIEATS